MFHRVLPFGHPAWADAEPAWTMPEQAFAECLRFFAKHYHVIALSQLLEAHAGSRALPERALIITFDDGWADNAEFALPHLKSEGLPATVFVVAAAVGEQEFWQETLMRAWRHGRLNVDNFERLWKATGNPDARLPWGEAKTIWRLIAELCRLDNEQRARLVEDCSPLSKPSPRRQMLSESELKSLHDSGIAIGSHGLTHTPIPYALNREAEFADSRTLIRQRLGAQPADGIRSFSFPHGIYDEDSAAAAERSGYQLLFTSDKHLNILYPGGRTRLLGRINMDSGALCDSSGRLRPEQLASWLFTRPLQSMSN